MNSASSEIKIGGNIASELYSDETTATQANDNLHGKERDSDDLWYDEDDDEEWQRIHNRFHTRGYRDGLIAGKEAAAQEGFNIGFKNSVFAGYNWGLVRGITSVMACLPGGLKEKLVETEETLIKFNHLHETVQSLSTTDALKLFYEDHKRKLLKEKESASSNVAVSNHPNSDTSVLDNYYKQLESLISKSPSLKGHLKVNY